MFEACQGDPSDWSTVNKAKYKMRFREETMRACRALSTIVRTLALNLRETGGHAIRVAQSGFHFDWISLAAMPRID